MRKVKPNDEIPIRLLTQEQAAKRVAQFNQKTVKRSVQKEMKKLNGWIVSLNGKTLDTVKFLSRVYKAADLYMQQEVYPNSVCAKGCAHCCCGIPVEATAIELSYIVEMAGVNLDIDWNAPESVGFGRPSPELTPCPLLDTRTATCKVYEHRPLQCRLFSSFDHYDLCEDPKGQHFTHRASSSPFWNLVLGNVALASQQAAKEKGITTVADLRDWIK